MKEIYSIKKVIVVIFLFILLYKINYEIIYFSSVSKYYLKNGLRYTPSLIKLFLSYLFFTITYITKVKNYKHISTYLIDLLLIFTIIPILSMYWQGDKSTEYTVYIIISYMILNLVISTNRKAKKLQFHINIKIETILIIITTISLIIFIYKYGFADFRALILENVYLIRNERNYDNIWKYIINWLPKSIIPCMIVIYNYKRKYLLEIVVIMMQFYLYLYTGNKTILFSIVLINIVIIFSKKREHFLVYMCIFLSFAIFVGSILANIFNNFVLLSITPMRLSSVPAMISYDHFEFFSKNEKLWFVETFIGRIFNIKSPYPVFSTFLVSANPNSNANTGYLGDAYANGGFLVMVFYSILLGYIFSYIDKLQKKTQYREILIGVFSYSIIILNDGSLTATLITGGLLFSLIIMTIFTSKNESKYHDL